MRKPAYTSEELTSAVERIERLTALMEKAERAWRSTAPENGKEAYKDSYQRLVRNIETSQLVYQSMCDKLNGVKK